MPLFGKDPRKFGKNGDIDLAAIMDQDFPINARINYRKVAEKREKASACHASQGGDRHSGYILTWIMRQISSNEFFMRAVPLADKEHVERDLFEGVNLEDRTYILLPEIFLLYEKKIADSTPTCEFLNQLKL